MKRTLHLIAGLLAALLTAVPAAAQDVSVQASVDETTVGSDEQVVYTIEIDGATFTDVETPSPPETDGLVLVQPTPSVQRNMSIVNGRMSQSIAYRWAFRPLRQEGPARIGATTVTVKGRPYRTAPIQLTVVPQAQRRQRGGRATWPAPPPPGDDATDDEAAVTDQDLFIRAIPSATQAYLNEQVSVEYRLYFRQGIQLGQSRLADSWDAEGFWREDLEVEARPIPELTVVNGLRYHTITLKRVSVFPTRAGRLQVDPLRIETEVLLPSRSRDPFEQFFSRRTRFRPAELSSPPVTIESRPLPSGAPPYFKGAVGDFRMDVHVDRSEMEVGESVQVVVTITGQGNLATLEAPPFQPPGVFEAYEPQVNTNINRSGNRITGSKTFTFILVPRSNGTFQLPPVRFAYLDPETGRYETLGAEPATIRVTGRPGAPLAASTATGLPVDDIAGLMTGGGAWVATNVVPLYRRPLVYALLLLPLLALAGLFAFRRHTARLATDTEYARTRRAHPVARRHLKQARTLLQENRPRAYYEELERAVLGFIGNRLNVAETGLTRGQLDAHLAAAGVDAATRGDLSRLLDACDRGRFSPSLPDRTALEQAYDEAARLIAVLDQVFGRTPVGA